MYSAVSTPSLQARPGTMYLDAYENALILDGVDEGDTIVIFLVECLMEEDNPPDALFHTVISTEQDLAVQPAILLSVLHPNLAQPFGHAA